MRIISGRYKGKRLSAPKKLPVRPTTDMAKEGIFNIINNRYFFEDIKVLDLFSGTGNIGFEFASRGTQNVTAVDAHVGCVQFIKRTSKELDFPIHVIKSDVFKFLERDQGSYDLIFADPPYHFDAERFMKLPDLVFQNDLLKAGGTLIVEHAPQLELDGHLNFREKRKYGSSLFSFFEKS